MRIKQIAVVVVVAALSLGALAAISSQQQVPSPVIAEMETFAVSSPPGFTEQDFIAYATALANGHALPSGWQIIGMEGKVKAIDTGLKLVPSNERLWTVTVIDDSPDIETVTVSIDGVQVAHANRQSGMIVDRSGMGIATMGIVVPPEGQAWQGRVEWLAQDGTVRSFDGAIGQ